MNTTADLVNHLVNKATKQVKLSGYYNPLKLTKDLEPKSFSDGSLAVVPDHTSQSDPDPLGHSADLPRPPH